jgi:hypothetical protein
MSQIDLKFATITMRDGYSGPNGGGFLVNHGGGYTAGATTMILDTGTGIMQDGDIFTVAGDTLEHTITAHSETASNTTSITFTPALGSNVADNALITNLPHRLEINISEGNCQFTEKRTMQYTLNRGRLDTVREGDEVPMEVKFDFLWEFLRSMSGATVPTPEEALKQIGAASDWVTSDPDTCQPYCIDLVIDYIPLCTTQAEELITMTQFRYEQLDHDPKAGQINCTGKCNVKQATVIRIPQS